MHTALMLASHGSSSLWACARTAVLTNYMQRFRAGIKRRRARARLTVAPGILNEGRMEASRMRGSCGPLSGLL